MLHPVTCSVMSVAALLRKAINKQHGGPSAEEKCGTFTKQNIISLGQGYGMNSYGWMGVGWNRETQVRTWEASKIKEHLRDNIKTKYNRSFIKTYTYVKGIQMKLPNNCTKEPRLVIY